MTLGIDPGYARMGFAFVEKKRNVVRARAYGLVETPKEMPFSERLHTIHKELSSLIERHAPNAAALEELFFSKNTKTALKVAEARGVIILTLALHDVPVFEYTPNEVKSAVTGNGRARKEEVMKMVALITQGALITQDDTADAVAVALCHEQRAKATRMREQGAHT